MNKALFNPKKFHGAISIERQNIEMLKKMLHSMLLIRKTEQQLAYARKNELINGNYLINSRLSIFDHKIYINNQNHSLYLLITSWLLFCGYLKVELVFLYF